MMAALVTSSQDLADDSFHPPLPHSPHVNDLKNRKYIVHYKLCQIKTQTCLIINIRVILKIIENF